MEADFGKIVTFIRIFSSSKWKSHNLKLVQI